MYRIFAVTMVLFGLSFPAAANQVLLPTSYDMNNGQTGWMVYHDQTYSGSGNSNLNDAPLSGGTGDLTDGLTSTDWDWQSQPEADPWVGWQSVNPVIVYKFPSAVQIDTLSLYTLRHVIASVHIPPSVLLEFSDGVGPFSNPQLFSFNDADYQDQVVHTLVLSVNATATHVRMSATDDLADKWIIFSETEFRGSIVPEPSSLVLAATGVIALLGAAMRRRRRD